MAEMPQITEWATGDRYLWAYAQHMEQTARSEPARHLFGLFAEQERRLMETRLQDADTRGEAMKKSMGSKGKKIVFQVTAAPGREVFVAGSFNNWNPTQYRMHDNPGSGHCKTTLVLPPGRHEYKFIVNGEWHMDTDCAESAPNDQGSMNSVIVV